MRKTANILCRVILKCNTRCFLKLQIFCILSLKLSRHEKIYYAYVLLQESKTQSDNNMNKRAKHISKKIKNKQLIPEKVETAFIKNSL